MTVLDDAAFLVLNAAHLNKMAGPAAIAAATGLDAAAVQRVLDQAERDGLGQRIGNQFLLFPDGSKAVLGHYNRAYAELRKSPGLEQWYERFETLNTLFIKHVTDWQNSGGDDDSQAKLIKCVERLMKMIDGLTPQIRRYGDYVRRFADSVAKTDQGDKDYVCSPMVDSVHNIWFEFHEDILSVLGRPRDTA
jgi:hypothetical protein